jgi:RNA polymerase sigma-70 factor (ECF subfamily)
VTDFAELYRHHSADVFRFALYLSGNRSEAEDITAETFVRAWTAPEPIRSETVRGYLLTIARNLFLQSLRRKSRHVELPDGLIDSSPGPQVRAELDSEVTAALEALQRLPEIDRSALLMRAADEMSYEEIARALGLTLAAVKVKIHRARLRLAQERERDARTERRAGRENS